MRATVPRRRLGNRHLLLTVAIGAASEVRMLGGVAGKGLDDRFRFISGFLQGSIAKIDDLLRMAQGPTRDPILLHNQKYMALLPVA
jgi:hypothetical protein